MRFRSSKTTLSHSPNNKAAVAVLLLFCLYVGYCNYSVVFCPFSIAITSLGEMRANLSAFRTFVRFVLV